MSRPDASVPAVVPRGTDPPAGRSAGHRTGEQTREAILEAARSTLTTGRGQLSVKAVAAQAGVSRQAIHYHFGGVAGLRAAVRRTMPGAYPASEDDGQPTRERLIDAATRVLSRPAGADASIETIAAEAGLTKGAVYHHFEDRTELLRAVARRFSPVDEITTALAETDGQPVREGLIALTLAYYTAVSARADLLRNLVGKASADPDLLDILMDEILSRGAPVILGWMRRRMDAGELRPGDPSLIVQALFGPAFLRIVFGPAIAKMLGEVGATLAVERVDAYVDVLLAGFAASPSGAA